MRNKGNKYKMNKATINKQIKRRRINNINQKERKYQLLNKQQ
jgi:hypothetical protein